MIKNYSIEVHNIRKNRWELYDTARTLDEAFEKAEKAWGFSEDYYDVCILDIMGFSIWESSGFRQGEGLKLPLFSEPEEPFVAKDGSC